MLENQFKGIAALIPGDLFSINEKARKFAFIRMDDQRVVAKEVMPDGRRTGVAILPMAGLADINLMVWAQEPVKDLSKEYALYDRVVLTGAALNGTVIDINSSKFPDVDVVVLWDSPLHGNTMTEVHPHEITPLGSRADNGVYQTACEAREFLKNIQDQRRAFQKQDVASQLAAVTAQKQMATERENERTEMAKQISETARVESNKIAAKVIEIHSEDLRRIMDAGANMILAGTYNYEVDQIPEYINSYGEYVYARVERETSNNDVKMPATAEVVKTLAKSILDSYFLVRQAYIRRHKGKWVIIAKSGKVLGSYDSKQDAVKRLRQIEYFKHHKG